MDRARVRSWIERTEEGQEPLDAFWAVASDPRTGLKRYRGGTGRPAPIVLQKKLAALLERAAPELLLRARDIANAKLAALSDDAIETVAEVMSGDIRDGRNARARLDAARLVLGALGIHERAAQQTQTNVLVSLGDGLRALRQVDVDVRQADVVDVEAADDGNA